jgi:hypothetical protein
MSNDMALFNPSQMPAFAKAAQPNALALALGGGGGSGGKRISIKGGVFRLIAGGKEIAQIEERYLDVVICAAQPKVGRMYYEGKWDPTKPATGPACWSPDGDKPDAAVKKPQASACMSCPQNVAGSGQGNSKACRFERRIAVVLANDIEGDVLQLALPSTSIFGDAENGNHPLHAYVKALSQQSINPDMVITRIKFDTTAEHPKLFFKPQGWLNEEQYKAVQKQGESEAAVKAITLTVSQQDGVKSEASVAEQEEFAPAPAAKPAAKKTTKAAEPVAEEEAGEPTVRKEKEAPKQVPTNDLAALANAWGDDD